MTILAEIESLLTTHGRRRYGLRDVSQLQHALQAALLAEHQHEPASLIAAALLHDIGHMVHELGENPAESRIDDRHEEHGHAWLTRHFGSDVTEPVRLHVAAKRYLCAIEPHYLSKLAPDSITSLELQGGPMTDGEVATFRASPHAQAAIHLRRFDDAAKVKDLPTPPVSHFMPYVAACLKSV
jgi:[1-hydroxy-2-(trimethylamino)ethyl]phosphonate dioxygenase